MNAGFFLRHTHPFIVVRWYVQNRLNGKRYISRVMEFVLIRHLGISEVLKETFILVLVYLTFISVPDCLKRVDSRTVKFDRMGYK